MKLFLTFILKHNIPIWHDSRWYKVYLNYINSYELLKSELLRLKITVQYYKDTKGFYNINVVYFIVSEVEPQ